ncbi:MAG: CotH kinase family protein [Lachnospiraceae bacterium]|nr:CotH kinase family protein [Lachnospiraceae bacterium]
MRKEFAKKCMVVLLAGMMLFTSCDTEKASESKTKETSAESSTDNSAESSADSSSDSSTDSSSGNSSDSSSADNDADAEKAAGPEVLKFSKTSGICDAEFDLTISSTDEKYSEIYYTLDGSNPATSSTAVKYEGAVPIKDRKNEKNVVSAVDPDLFCANFSKVNSAKTNFECTIKAPSDDAVDKCTTIRAVAKNEKGELSREENAVYFFGTMEEHIKGLSESASAAGYSLAVVSLSMDYDDLFDYKTGIYVKGEIFQNAVTDYFNQNKRRDPEDGRKMDANFRMKGREWEKEAGMTLLEVTADGKTSVALSHNCGVRVQGNYSRSDLQKGLRLYARKEYGPKNFRYPIFGTDYVNDSGDVMDKFKTIMLRAGGNTAFSAKFNDTFWQSLCADMTTDIQMSRPCVLYINGEYFGLYVLQEDYSDNYFQNLHGVEKDDVVLYKGDAEALKLGYKLDEGELPAGVTDESYYFRELLDFIKTHKTLKKQEDYDAFVKLVDPKSVMEYFAVEVWIDNKWDWPGKNWSMWKTTSSDGTDGYGDGRWRFVFYDVEFGGFSGDGDVRHNTIKEDNYKPNGLLDMNTNNPAVLCFALLMTNDGFRKDYEDMLYALSDETFSEERAGERLEWFKNVYSPLYPQFFERYKGAGKISDAEGSINNIKAFLKKRKDNIKKMVDYCEKILG